MRTFMTAAVLLALAPQTLAQVTISQVHAHSSLYSQDYVELFNTTGNPVSLSGWALGQYSYPSGGFSMLNLAGVIPAHGYFLVAVPTTGTGTGSLPTPPDMTGTLPMILLRQAVFIINPNPYPVEADRVSWSTGYPPAMDGTNALLRYGGGCHDSDLNTDFDAVAPAPRNSSITHVCPFVGPDCNRNGVDDLEEIASDPTLDCNGNHRLESCETNPWPPLDCNNNGIPDCEEIRSGAPDVNDDRQPDTCYAGAAVVSAPACVTVLETGVSQDTTVLRAAGSQAAGGAAFVVLRWDGALLRQALGGNGPYGYDQWPYLDLHAAAGVDAAGSVDVFFTHNDAITLSPGAPAPTAADLDTLFGDRERLNTIDFHVRAPGAEFPLFLSGSLGCPAPPNTPTAHLIADIWQDATVSLLLVARPGTAASFAGLGYPSPGPRLVFFARPQGPFCGNADYNGDGDVGTDADIYSFFACLAGNCCPTCMCMDFNGDGDWGTDADIEAFFRVLAGSC